MAKIKYYYDTTTARFKIAHTSVWPRILGAIGIAFLSLALAILLGVVYGHFFELPSELKLKDEIAEMEVNYETLNNELTVLHQVMATIERRDDDVYRTVLGAEPIDGAVRKGGVGGVERYLDISEKKMAHSEVIVQLYSKIDRLRRKLYIESVSQDELMQLAEDKTQMNSSIPAIQPISNKQLTALSSGFGLRTHPFYKTIIMHMGIDFAAPEGTPVYSTADGVVVATDTAVFGYGKIITIDHGHGYHTRYAHLQQFATKLGKTVKRGEMIARVGNTGLSTGSHIHYEVLLQGIQINPVHYFFNDLNAGEYQKITELASVQNQTMGN